MDSTKFIPASGPDTLRERIIDFFKSIDSTSEHFSTRPTLNEPNFDLFEQQSRKIEVVSPRNNITCFLDFVSASIPDGDIYLFGGLIRDLAIFGRKGFTSDIDVVVDGDWEGILPIFESYGASKNKFGGYRLQIENWPVDIWKAEETWAIKKGLVPYHDISSLTLTTILNWDGILMNWRTKNFLYAPNYFESIHDRALDITLTENPNPLGTVVRVLRHLRHKDAAKISGRAVAYIANATEQYSYDQISNAEVKSYGKPLINAMVYRFFKSLSSLTNDELARRFNHVDNVDQESLRDELIGQVSLFKTTGNSSQSKPVSTFH